MRADGAALPHPASALRGTWWEGLDPAELYGPPPALRTEAWKAEDDQVWLARQLQLIRDYKPDALYFDSQHDEVRFTTRAGRLFMFILNPAPGELRVPVLGRESAAQPGAIRAASLLADGTALTLRQDADAPRLQLPDGIATGLPLVVVIDGAG